MWAKDLTICNSCKKEYAIPATYHAFPLLNDGTNSPHPFPLCDMHAIPYALVAGWKPVKIENREAISGEG